MQHQYSTGIGSVQSILVCNHHGLTWKTNLNGRAYVESCIPFVRSFSHMKSNLTILTAGSINYTALDAFVCMSCSVDLVSFLMMKWTAPFFSVEELLPSNSLLHQQQRHHHFWTVCNPPPINFPFSFSLFFNWSWSSCFFNCIYL